MHNQFFSNQSFLSLAGASGMVFVMSNALQGAFNFNPRWLALALAEIIAVYGTYLGNGNSVPSDYVVSLLNGCLIYCTAVGGTTLADRRPKGRAKAVSSTSETGKRGFLTSWF